MKWLWDVLLITTKTLEHPLITKQLATQIFLWELKTSTLENLVKSTQTSSMEYLQEVMCSVGQTRSKS